MHTTANIDSVATTTVPDTQDTQEGPKSETINRIASSAHQAVDRMAQGAGSALQSLRGSSEAWKDTGDQSLEHVQDYVRERPLLALGIAVAAGFLLSRLMR